MKRSLRVSDPWPAIRQPAPSALPRFFFSFLFFSIFFFFFFIPEMYPRCQLSVTNFPRVQSPAEPGEPAELAWGGLSSAALVGGSSSTLCLGRVVVSPSTSLPARGWGEPALSCGKLISPQAQSRRESGIMLRIPVSSAPICPHHPVPHTAVRLQLAGAQRH